MAECLILVVTPATSLAVFGHDWRLGDTLPPPAQLHDVRGDISTEQRQIHLHSLTASRLARDSSRRGLVCFPLDEFPEED